jgi:hypothetical protein
LTLAVDAKVPLCPVKLRLTLLTAQGTGRLLLASHGRLAFTSTAESDGLRAVQVAVTELGEPLEHPTDATPL